MCNPFSGNSKKIIHELFLGFALHAGGIWKRDKLVAEIEELEKMDASKIFARRLNTKEVISQKKLVKNESS